MRSTGKSEDFESAGIPLPKAGTRAHLKNGTRTPPPDYDDAAAYPAK